MTASLVLGAITPKDPSNVLAGKVILKRADSIYVQVTSQDPLIETLRYFVATPGGGLPYETDGDARRKF